VLKDGRALVRCSAKLARALGLSYRELWQQLKSGQSGFKVHEIPTVSARRTLKFLDLRDVNAALGYPFHDPPTLGVRGAGQPDANTHNLDGDGDGEDDEEEHDKHVE
jgi:hypothetical protein